MHFGSAITRWRGYSKLPQRPAKTAATIAMITKLSDSRGEAVAGAACVTEFAGRRASKPHRYNEGKQFVPDACPCNNR